MADKKVNLIITNDTFIDGELVPQGTVLRDQEAEPAYVLVGAGKAAVATSERIEAAEKAAADKLAAAKLAEKK